MYTSTIAKIINAFNITATSIVVCFAVVGVFFIILKIFRFNILGLRRANIILKTFCVAALAAFAIEATAFNFPHYLKYFAGPPTGITEVSENNPNIIQTTDGTHAELIQNGIRFNNLNRNVTSVFVDMNFNNTETVEGIIKWTDEATTQQYTKRFYKYLPHENYALLQSCGKVSEFTIAFNGNSSIDIADVVINKPISFYFSGLRLLVVSFLFFAFFAFVNKNLRAKAAYYLLEYKFDPKNKKQNIVYACMVALLILFSWVCVYTSAWNYGETSSLHLYDRFLVDALIDGRTFLDYGNPEKLLNAEHPYHPTWRNENGYREGVDWMNDWVWYKGKYYCYTGVVPAVILYVPYKMITGNYLSNHAGVFLFCAITVFLLAMLWRYCAKKYMHDIKYALYLLLFLTLFFASGWYMILRYQLFYCIVQSAGAMFTVAGVLLLLKSIDDRKINYMMLFFACLCFALVFGCRPNMGLASLLIPIVLWRQRSWKLILFVMLPYIIIAIPLCAYNYVRFGSIFEFGIKYMTNWYNDDGYRALNPIGKLVRTSVSFVYYLFYPNSLSLRFPFVETSGHPTVLGVTLGGLNVAERGSAIINFPIVFCLFYIFKNIFNKNRPKIFYLLYSFLIIAVFITALDSFLIGYVGRYALDAAAFIILPSLFCAYYWINDETSTLPFQFRMKIIYVLCVISILTGLFLFVNPKPGIYFDPALYRYLEYSLGIIRDV